ncbi:MAG: NUDIX domain-containing protein [Victivallales bacterium]|nr:NUDIX domain-containing protein [Victivallales bacterium]MCF7889273.1 NUDIX domain-containing protein [Victivallales bacterium]
MQSEEYLEIVDEQNNVIGRALRSECHGKPELIHRTAHLIIENDKGEILLQKRSMNKDIQPCKWDTAAAGHFIPGESAYQAVRREMNEELGIPINTPVSYIFDIRIRNEIESENVSVYKLNYNGPFNFQKEEIDEVSFWTVNELKGSFGKEIITPACEKELKLYLSSVII